MKSDSLKIATNKLFVYKSYIFDMYAWKKFG